MPALRSRELTLAFDLRGCPNRCRHCYLGCPPNRRMSEAALRDAVAAFRAARAPTGEPLLTHLQVMTWAREPDFAPNYRRLYDLEAELSDSPPQRFELLSIWRLARDPGYAPWAKSVGTAACQISFFGLGATQDWFVRRRGAFDDCLVATERLIEAGVAPRWQLFLTRRILPELDDLLRLVDTLRLRERVAAMGGAFQIFIHAPGPDGAARQIEHLRPTLEETRAVPQELVAASRAYLRREALWRAEADLLAEIAQREERFPHTYDDPASPAFYILANGDVFSNIGTWEPWWRVGNLAQDAPAALVARYEADDCPGLRAIRTLPARDLARAYGDPASQRVYSSADDLLALYLARRLESDWPQRNPPFLT